MSNVLYRKLKRIGACEARAREFKGMSLKQAWETVERENDFFWLIRRLKQRGKLTRHPCFDSLGYLKPEAYNALYHADPKPVTRRTRYREGRKCVEAMQTLFTYNQIKHALSKVKLPKKRI